MGSIIYIWALKVTKKKNTTELFKPENKTMLKK